MISFSEAQKVAIEQLEALDINAVAHAREIADLPVAIVAPENFNFNRLTTDAYHAKFAIYLIAPDTGHEVDSLDYLSEMAGQIKHHFGAREFEMVALTLQNVGGSDSLPALKTNITLNVKKEEEDV